MLSTATQSRLSGLCLMSALALVAIPDFAAAQGQPTAQELMLKMQLCRSIEIRGFRLQCFDRVANGLTGKGESAPAMVQSEPAAEAPQVAATPPNAPAATPAEQGPAPAAREVAALPSRLADARAVPLPPTKPVELLARQGDIIETAPPSEPKTPAAPVAVAAAEPAGRPERAAGPRAAPDAEGEVARREEPARREPGPVAVAMAEPKPAADPAAEAPEVTEIAAAETPGVPVPPARPDYIEALARLEAPVKAAAPEAETAYLDVAYDEQMAAPEAQEEEPLPLAGRLWLPSFADLSDISAHAAPAPEPLPEAPRRAAPQAEARDVARDMAMAEDAGGEVPVPPRRGAGASDVPEADRTRATGTPETPKPDAAQAAPAPHEPPEAPVEIGGMNQRNKVVVAMAKGTAEPRVKGTWSVSDWTSPISGVRDISISRASDRVADEPITLLSFSCSGGTGAVRVMWPSGMSAKQIKAKLIYDGKEDDAATWSLSPDGRTMSREGGGAALAVARKLAAASRVTVRLDDGPAHEREATFTADGFKPHLADMKAACNG